MCRAEGGVLKIIKGSMVFMRGKLENGGLNELNKQKLLGKDDVWSLQFCEHCILGKVKRLNFVTVVHHSKGILDFIHSDV